jgi:hypothetical protein
MAFPDYKRDLLAADFDESRVLDRYFHSGQSVAFVGAHPEEEPLFKRDLARRLDEALSFQLHPLQLIVCGSAHLGFSPVPDKLGKPFNSLSSDIDVAIVSTELFDRWWAELQVSELVPAVLTTVARDLFRGFIDPSNVNNASETGCQWWQVFGNIESERAKGVRGRIYRNHWSMQNYHRSAINGGRRKLLGMRT